MKTKLIISDLDNTIFPVKSIGDELFAPLFRIIEEDGRHSAQMDQIRDDVMRIPFQKMAKQYNFSQNLIDRSIELLKRLEWKGNVTPFDDFSVLRSLPVRKMLVTAGFTPLQQSKADALSLQDDFDQIIIIDPEKTTKQKKDVFEEVMRKYHYHPQEILIVGDDLDSEIRAAQELGMVPVLYDKFDRYEHVPVKKIHSFEELVPLVQ